MDLRDVQTVYKALVEAGEEFGVGDFGTYALNGMRLEKGFRMWSAEVSVSSQTPTRKNILYIIISVVNIGGKKAETNSTYI